MDKSSQCNIASTTDFFDTAPSLNGYQKLTSWKGSPMMNKTEGLVVTNLGARVLIRHRIAEARLVKASTQKVVCIEAMMRSTCGAKHRLFQ